MFYKLYWPVALVFFAIYSVPAARVLTEWEKSDEWEKGNVFYEWRAAFLIAFLVVLCATVWPLSAPFGAATFLIMGVKRLMNRPPKPWTTTEDSDTRGSYRG